MITVFAEGNIVHEQRTSDDGKCVHFRHTCDSHRVAQVTAAKIDLASKGWTVSGIGSGDSLRLPLLLAGEKMGRLLDGTLSNRRAQGFVARRGDDVINVDACAGMSLRIFVQVGDTARSRVYDGTTLMCRTNRQLAEAIETCHWHLGE